MCMWNSSNRWLTAPLTRSDSIVLRRRRRCSAPNRLPTPSIWPTVMQCCAQMQHCACGSAHISIEIVRHIRNIIIVVCADHLVHTIERAHTVQMPTAKRTGIYIAHISKCSWSRTLANTHTPCTSMRNAFNKQSGNQYRATMLQKHTRTLTKANAHT